MDSTEFTDPKHIEAAPNRAVKADDLRTVYLGTVRILDVAVVLVFGAIAYWLRHGQLDMPQVYIVAMFLAALLTYNYMQILGAYSRDHFGQLGPRLTKVAQAWAAVVLTIILIAFFTKTSTSFSRIWVGSWMVLSLAAMVLARLAVWGVMRRWQAQGLLTSNLILIGSRSRCADLVTVLGSMTDENLKIDAIFEVDAVSEPDGNNDGPSRYSIDDLESYISNNSVDDAIVAMPMADDILIKTIRLLKAADCDVELNPPTIGYELPNLGSFEVNGATMVRVAARPISGWGHVVKAIEDRLIGAILLLFAAPLMALIALAIKIESRGPAIFQQQRLGFRNNEFTIFKFRSMAVEASSAKVVQQATKDDARVTKVGAFLRRTSLDELPQLLNVIRGEMSLVGPRPHVVVHNEQYAAIIDEYLSRHKVKPGITGWAQVNGFRGETDTIDKMLRRVQHDLYYIDNWSFWFDLKILAKTVFTVVSDKNAY